jgi:predicted polyphosphate/ATP-dependent NAD kinase
MVRKEFTLELIIGLIVNPIAGMGGRVGLKGTDSLEILEEAIRRGAEPKAGDRTKKALDGLQEINAEWVTWEGKMGEDILNDLGFDYRILGEIEGDRTSPQDTKNAAKKMVEYGVDLIIFVGGDGTAVDIVNAVDKRSPILGIPSGVKMYSAVFASTPQAGKEIIRRYSQGELHLDEREIMDIDEDAYREGRLSADLEGYALTPISSRLLLSEKMSGLPGDVEVVKEAIAERIVENMEPGVSYALGPGSTVGAIADKLGIDKTVLGVDVIKGGELILKDANEKDLLSVLDINSKIILSPLGGQGSLLGRGNQQISPEIIHGVGIENIIVVATPSKLRTFSALTVDTGDQDLDEKLRGYIRVIVGYHETKVMKVK